MKKYLSLFVVLAIAFFVNVPATLAQDDTSVGADVNASIDTRAVMTPAQKRAEADARMKAQLEAQAELRIKRTTTEAEI